jgi:hypothetical protein
VGSMTGGVVRIALVAEQSGHRGIGPKDHRPARSAVATSGPPLGATFGPHKRSNPRTSVSGAEADSDPVNEHDRLPPGVRATRL